MLSDNSFVVSKRCKDRSELNMGPGQQDEILWRVTRKLPRDGLSPVRALLLQSKDAALAINVIQGSCL